MVPVTVAIPTYNRSGFLAEAIESALCQTEQQFELLVIDNDSQDDTPQVVKSFKDQRIRYVRNDRNIGMIENWNKSINLARGQHVLILGDDDKLRPDFLEKSLSIHRRYPGLGFTFTHCDKVDASGNFLKRWGYEFPSPGYLKGKEYIYLTITYGCCLTNSSTVLVSRDAYNTVGPYKQVYGANTFDLNMWIRIANSYDVFFIDQSLVDYRLHTGQISELHWRRVAAPTGKIGTHLELIDAFSRLLQDPKYLEAEKRQVLLNRLLDLDAELSQLLIKVIPEL